MSSLMSIDKKRHHYQGFYTTRVKWIEDKFGVPTPVEIMQSDRLLFNPFHIESKSKDHDIRIHSDIYVFSDESEDLSERPSEKTSAENKYRAMRRARNNIRDIVECNIDLDLFVTLTFNQNTVDRYSYSDIIKRLKIWLSNRSQRHGLKYVLIPEHHKDGAIHFHGFFNSSAVRLTNSGHCDKGGHAIYNIVDFSFGFTTAVRVGESDEDRQKVSCYILKYVTKGTEKVGGRYYLHGGDLKSPRFTYSNDAICDDLCTAEPYIFSPFHGCTMKIYNCRMLSHGEKRSMQENLFPRKARTRSVSAEKDDLTV